MLLFCGHSMDTTPKGWVFSTQGGSKVWFSWLHLYVGLTACFTLFYWGVVIELVQESNPYGLNEYVSLYGLNLGNTNSPVFAWSMSFAATLIFYFCLHEPCYWFHVVAGFMSSCFTGAIAGGVPSMQNPLVILYTFANLDSTNWGTRATADHGLYAGGDQDTLEYKTSLWKTKVGLCLSWLAANIVVSFLCVYSYVLFGDYLGPEIYGYPWLTWPALFATYFIFGGRYLDWFVGRCVIYHREKGREMTPEQQEEDTLHRLLGFFLGLRVMSCELPCHRDLSGTHCDTGAFKLEKPSRGPRSARWSWDADRDSAPGTLTSDYSMADYGARAATGDVLESIKESDVEMADRRLAL